MKKVSATFLFTEKYDSVNFIKEEVQVWLEIDYEKSTFSISPGYNKNDFVFKHNSKDYKKWIAVLNCIRAAIDFANKELGLQ